jgi:hypothetical protein
MVPKRHHLAVNVKGADPLLTRAHGLLSEPACALRSGAARGSDNAECDYEPQHIVCHAP